MKNLQVLLRRYTAAILGMILCIWPAPGIWAQDLKMPGDAPVKIEADELSYDQERDLYVAQGNVAITYGDGVLTAARAEYNRKSNLATAEGNALLRMAQDSLAGDKIVVNVEDKTGVAYNSKAFYARNHFYIRGSRIEKTGESTYFIEEPVATTCDGDKPDWEIAGHSMNVTLEGYGLMKDARLKARHLPVFYTPLVAFPAKTKRQSGFLFPYLGYSKDKDGLDIEIPFFWAIDPRKDATFFSRYMEKRGYKQGVEFRYYAGEKSFGTLYGDFMEDNRQVTETAAVGSQSRDWQGMHRRWSYYLNHQTNFDSQFYVRTDLRRVSDSWYFRDFNAHNYYLSNYAVSEKDPFRKVPFQGNESLPSLESSARIYKGWNNFSLMARVNSTDDFSAVNNDRTLQQYPEIVFTGIKQPFLSTPLYYEWTGNYDYFYRGEGQKGHYVDVAPTISLPFNVSRFAKVTPQITLREVYWNRDDSQANSDNKSGNRTVYNAGLSISSRISRVFAVKIQNLDKIKHEIKPEIFYSYIPEVNQDNLPDFIPWVNSFMANSLSSNIGYTNALTEQNAVAWALTNTLTARAKNKSGANSYIELLRFKLFQMYDINEAKKDMAGSNTERRPVSDLGIELDLKPHPYVAFAARNKYNPYVGWKEMNYDLGLSDWRGDHLTLGYRYTLDYLEEINMLLKVNLIRGFSGNLGLRLDRFNDRTVENTVGVAYRTQCWGVGVDYTKTYDDERFMLKFSLAGLGVF
ncbi:MAG TPA: LPS assembly protein LptD [Smithellaceae bacterium]|nr:LPS assembly protein LptD [Smithellaceae bacterium]HRS82120.1 LPS assembly protein LptD [Smithellaceae bacterium]HRV43877.1 LPS assembly protein LptD [Smithellaceae bacterium]